MPIPEPEPCQSCEPSRVITSPDGTRAVWIRGWDHDAFLYDLTQPPAFPPRWLDWDVMDANFFMDEQTGQLMELQLSRYDGQQSWFDPDGNPIGPDGAAPAPDAPAVPSRADTMIEQLKPMHASLNETSADQIGPMLR